MLHALTLIQFTRYSMPLIRMVRVWTGDSPVIVTRLFEVVMLLFTVSLNSVASSWLSKVWIAPRWPEIKVLASPNAERGAIPEARNARYLASIIGSTLFASIGPFIS